MDTSRPDFPHVAGSMAPTPGRKVEDRGLSGVPMLGRGNGRPSRPEVERVALDLLRRRGAEILATARRYSSSDEDAEDAYQRGLDSPGTLVAGSGSPRRPLFLLRPVGIRPLLPDPHDQLAHRLVAPG